MIISNNFQLFLVHFRYVAEGAAFGSVIGLLMRNDLWAAHSVWFALHTVCVFVGLFVPKTCLSSSRFGGS